MTRMQDEYKETVGAAKEAATNLKNSIDDNAPPMLVRWINAIMYHPGTPWFFLGSAVEAFGLSAQFLFMGASYPLLDGFVALAIAILIAKKTGVKLV